MTVFKNLFFAIIIFSFCQVAAQTQAELTMKAHNDYQKSDKELNKVYKQLLSNLDETEKALLIKAQKDWIKFRDSHCEFEAQEYDGGSMQPMVHSICLKERTEERIEDLKTSIQNFISK